jgi:hypothetical protein
MAYNNSEIEQWEDVVGYEDYYMVSSLGNIKSKNRIVKNSRGDSTRFIASTLLKQVNYMGYNCVCFCVAGKIKQKVVKVHRIVAESFILNYNSKPCVNHIDGNKLNNRLDNLEWVTYAENSQHALITGLRKGENNSKSRIVLNIENGVFYNTIKEAANSISINYRTLINMLQNVSPNKTNLRYV